MENIHTLYYALNAPFLILAIFIPVAGLAIGALLFGLLAKTYSMVMVSIIFLVASGIMFSFQIPGYINDKQTTENIKMKVEQTYHIALTDDQAGRLASYEGYGDYSSYPVTVEWNGKQTEVQIIYNTDQTN